MSTKKHLVRVGFLVATISSLAVGQETPASSSPTVRKANLSATNYQVSGLNFQVVQFVANTSAGGYLPLIGLAFPRAKFVLKIENKSSQVISWNPSAFVVVNEDGNQANLLKIRLNNRPALLNPIDIIPNSSIEVNCSFSREFKLPSKIYYNGTIVTTVVE